ncbi:MAG: hypothetical protein V1678_03180, partial [Candidatus Aenigmatarchaeota archaeon]
MKEWIFVTIILFLFFTTPVYAFSSSDVFSWMENIFGRITGYVVTQKQSYETATLLPCPYECCSSDDKGYEEKACPEPKFCKENKCIDVIAETAITIQSSSLITEQVKCIFTDSDAMQECYTADGRFGCSGAGTCIANIAGENGTKFVWKSSCPDVGYVETIADGYTEYVAFKCATPTGTPGPAPTTIPTEVIKEQVKCIFANSNSEQKCYAEGFTCGGTGTCVVDVSGEKSKMLTWKSTCGGYAYTVMDGNNEYAEFNCQASITHVSTSATNKTVTSTSTQICMDSDGDNHFLKGYVESGVDTFRHTDYDTCWVINSDTDYHAAPECTGANCYVLEGG